MRKYLQQIVSMFPRGWAWSAQRRSKESAIAATIAAGLERADGRAMDLMREIDPRTTNEMLPEWERELALPDPCTPAGQTQAERRASIIQKLTAIGGQSAAYFRAIASSLGYQASVIEFRPFRAGISRASHALTNGVWRFHWRLAVADAVPVRAFKAGQGAANESLRTWGNEQLECVIRSKRPAHTTVDFSYG